MRTRIICSTQYAKMFREELSEAEFSNIWENIVRIGKRFHEVYKFHISDILKTIPRKTGFKWAEFAPAEVPIYLVDSKGPSISSPLTLKIRENVEYMVTVLTHELTHINMPGTLFDDKFQYEDVVNQVTLNVCRQIRISAGFETIAAYQEAMQKGGFVRTELNLEEKTLRETLSLNYHPCIS